jgi:glycosyltransferase involved in cell wall biosynthesis
MLTSKDRIAFFLPGLYEGGAERVILNLAEGVAERGFPVDLVLARAEGPYMSQVPQSVRLIDLKAMRVLTSVPALTRYLCSEQPTALLSALFANLIALMSRRLSGLPRRLVISEHNTLSSVSQQQPDLRWQLYPKLAGWLYPGADDIIAVSHGVAEDLARTTTIPRHRIQVVYNPVVTADVGEKSKIPLDHPWFKPGEPPVILAVGRLTRQKAFDVLIRAFSQVQKRCPARLLILGEGEDRSMLESLIKQLGLETDINLPGFVQNPYPYMTRAALLVLPSRWEGLPTVLIEALYLGTPIVATDCPGGSREILKNGEYGRLVPVDSDQMLADAITTSLNCHFLCPPSESWTPYTLDFVVDRYLKLLVQAKHA